MNAVEETQAEASDESPEIESDDPVEDNAIEGGAEGNSASERGEGPNNADSQHAEGDDDTTGSPKEMTYTPRFTGLIALFATLIIAGILTFNPAAIAAAGTLLVFLAASIMHTPASTANRLTAQYTITPTNPRPSEHATITLTITNTSDTTFTDLRLIDTVPEELKVTDGTPRAAQALRPNESLTITYDVLAKRGTYTFGPVVTRARTLMGTMWIQEVIQPEAEKELRCAVEIDNIPLEDQATNYIGRLLGNTGGEGVEFHSTREYHRGDSPSRINWRELAKRNELSTITYREQQAAHVTVISDARIWARASAGSGTTSAAVLGAYAAYQLTASLTAQGHYVGMVAPGIQPRDIEQESQTPFPYRRFEHGNDVDQQHRAFRLLQHIDDTVTSSDYDPTDTAPLRNLGEGTFRDGKTGNSTFDINPYKRSIDSFVHDLTGWAGDTTQFIYISPLLDDGAHGLCTQLHKMGCQVIVISPDIITASTTAAEHNAQSQEPTREPTGTRTSISQRMIAVQRATRIESLRHAGITIIDWEPDTPLSVACKKQTVRGES